MAAIAKTLLFSSANYSPIFLDLLPALMKKLRVSIQQDKR